MTPPRPGIALPLMLLLASPAVADTAVQSTDQTTSQSTAPQADHTDGSTMTVTASRLSRELLTTPMAMSVVDEEEIQRGQQRVRIDESLVRVPGVFIQNRDNFAQGARVSIRGFGARAPFGVRGVTVPGGWHPLHPARWSGAAGCH